MTYSTEAERLKMIAGCYCYYPTGSKGVAWIGNYRLLTNKEKSALLKKAKEQRNNNL
jgi:hypothetical protein